MKAPGRAAALLLAGALLASPHARAAPVPTERVPRWPTEVNVAAAALLPNAAAPSEADRLEAVRRLALFATKALEPALLAALDDPSPHVVRALVALCVERELASCRAHAEKLWRHPSTTPGLRVEILTLLALSPAPAPRDDELLTRALDDPSPEVRRRAARVLSLRSLAPTDPLFRGLVARLGDPELQVRVEAVRSLGQLGAREGLMAVRLRLDDSENAVRVAAIEALARHPDASTLPMLDAWLQGRSEPELARAALLALARHDGPNAELRLLSALDHPPKGVTHQEVARIVGRRAQPSADFLRALIDRGHDLRLRGFLVPVLARYGEVAHEPIRRAIRAGGLDPAFVDELVALVEPAVAGPSPVAGSSPSAGVYPTAGSSPATELQRVAQERRAPIAQRCLAIQTLARAGQLTAPDPATTRTTDADPRLRACRALVTTSPQELELFTFDPDDVVRASAAWRLGVGRSRALGPLVRARLAFLAERDPSAAVRRLAKAGVAGTGGDDATRARTNAEATPRQAPIVVRYMPGAGDGGPGIPRFVELETEQGWLPVPLLGDGAGFLTALPPLADGSAPKAVRFAASSPDLPTTGELTLSAGADL